MRIVHILRTLDPAAGGPPMVATRLAAAQCRLGHSVALLTDDTQRHTHDLPGIPGPQPDVLLGRSQLALVVAGSDAVHLHGVWDPILRNAASVAAKHDVPYVVTPHGMLDPWSLAQKRWKKRLALWLGYRKMLNRAAALHLLNSDESDLLTPLALKSAPVVIPNGVFLEEIPPAHDIAPAEIRSTVLPQQPFVLFIGRLHFKKGLDYLAEAFRLVAARRADVHLVVAGPDDGARSDFEHRCREAGIADRAHLTGPLYGADKWRALRQAACFCLPSRQEGFSVAILEAMACGTPVVISEQCHFPEIAEAGAGAIVALDAVSIADGLHRFLEDPELRRRSGAAGRRLVEARFTWPVIAERTIEIYQSHARLRERPTRKVSCP